MTLPQEPKLSGAVPGPRSLELEGRRRRAVARGVATMQPVYAAAAHGAVVEDVDGNRFIDFTGGLGVLNAGHTPPAVVAALKAQLDAYLHTCQHALMHEPYVAVAEALNRLTPGDYEKRTMLANSGAEATENVVKIARAATGRQGVAVFDNAFHGRTLLALAMTAKHSPYKDGYHPFPPEVHRLPFPYCYRCPFGLRPDGCGLACADEAARQLKLQVGAGNVAALIVEPVQGEGGFIAPPPGWLERIAETCRELDIPFVADEVQSGFGRTGTLYALEQAPGVVPDFTLSAKSIASGLPLAAVTGRSELMDVPRPGGLGGTYGGNPLACVAALATIEMFETTDLLDRAERLGHVLGTRLREMGERYRIVGEVRGLGAMMALELVTDRRTREPAREATTMVLAEAARHGLLTLKAGMYDNVVRILAPLVIEPALLDEGLDVLDRALATVDAEVS
ncbi:MAG TPA: aminotransferase class III-fold pyridoxal phosphate-dependent enzyme [Actinomycetes bacterium]|nr:aminotransferase class III-fold pyridoxal phosphate-dependent enzyme [Actinomycetes bacterium]